MIWSALRTVDSRWAMVMVVRPRARVSKACWTARSVSVSRALVASSTPSTPGSRSMVRAVASAAGPLVADRSERAAGRDVQVDAGQGGAVGARVGEADILETDMAGYPGRVDADRPGRLVYLDRQVEVLEDPREQGQRADHGHAG